MTNDLENMTRKWVYETRLDQVLLAPPASGTSISMLITAQNLVASLCVCMCLCVPLSACLPACQCVLHLCVCVHVFLCLSVDVDYR